MPKNKFKPGDKVYWTGRYHNSWKKDAPYLQGLTTGKPFTVYTVWPGDTPCISLKEQGGEWILEEEVFTFVEENAPL